MSVITACGVPSGPELYDAAVAALEAGEPRTAEIHLRNLLQRVPDHARGRQLLGELLLNTGDPAAAEHNLREAVALGVDVGEVQLQLLRALLNQGKFEGVIEQLAATPPMVGDREVVRRNIEGAAHRALRNFEAAEAAYNAALAIDPGSTLTRVELANLFLDAGRIGEAQALAIAIDAESPRDVPSKLVLGRANARMGRYAEAEEWFRRALELAEGGPVVGYITVLSHVIEAELAQGKVAEADADADALLARAVTPHTVSLKARVDIERGDLVAAERRLEEVLRAAPDYWPAHALLGRTNAAEGQWGQAEIHLRIAMDNSPDDAVSRLRLAELYLLQGNLPAARALFRSIKAPLTPEALVMAAVGQGVGSSAGQQVSLRPEDDDLVLEAANAYVVAGELVSAARLLAAVPIATAASDPLLVHVVTIAQLWRGDVASAAETLRKLAAGDQPSAWLATLRGAVAARGGDFAAADALFADALLLEPQYSPALLGVARAAFARGAETEADRAVGRLLEGYPERSVNLLGLASRAIGRGDFDEARAWLDNAPGDPIRSRLEGDLAMREGNFPQALAAYRRSYELRPTAELGHRIYLAAKAAGEDRPERTLAEFAAAHPRDLDAKFVLGSLAIESGDHRAAAAHYEAMLALDPDDPRALNNLAWLYGELGDARAVDLAKRARDALPKHPGVADTLGWLLVREGNVEAGLPLLEEALRGAPMNGDIRYHWAYALAESGKVEQAAGALDALLRTGGEFSSRDAATELLRRLRESR